MTTLLLLAPRMKQGQQLPCALSLVI